MSDDSKRFRFPGPISYGDSALDQRLFFGRDTEISELRNRVMSDRLLVLYGKSGIGKTSLLQAGLFPALREQNFLPIYLRPQEMVGDISKAVASSIESTCERFGYKVSLGEADDLWTLLNGLVISHQARFLTPVLVFDQFEEILRPERSDFCENLISQLSPLISGFNQNRRDGAQRTPNTRIVLSLREEFVGTLHRFAEQIPRILEHRFRLEGLSRSQAKVAIEAPTQIESQGQLATDLFSFEAELVDDILNFIVIDNSVDPIQLQIICHFAEEIISRRSDIGDRPIVMTDFLKPGEKLNSVIEAFYLRILDNLPDHATRFRVRNLCEFGLITSSGYRDVLPSQTIKSRYGLTQEVLDRLVDVRLLRIEDRRSDLWYELSHDRIAESVHANRRRPGRWALAASFLILIASLGIWQYNLSQSLEFQGELASYLEENLDDSHSHFQSPTVCSDCHEITNSENHAILLNNFARSAERGMEESGVCIDCHKDLVGNAQVTNFSSDHPDRIVDPDLRDPHTLKFPHSVHMAETGIDGPAGKEVMTCVDCHAFSRSILETDPLTFESACERCHQLTYDPGQPGKFLRHDTVAATLEALEEAANEKLESLRDGAINPITNVSNSRKRLRRIPGVPLSESAEVFVATRPNESSAGPTSEGFLRQYKEDVFERQTCGICHEVIKSENSYEINWTPPTKQFLNQIDFRHYDHAQEDCVSCHRQSESSMISTDILIPYSSTCAECHDQNSDSGEATCTTCHQFHPWKTELRSRGANISD